MVLALAHPNPWSSASFYLQERWANTPISLAFFSELELESNRRRTRR